MTAPETAAPVTLTAEQLASYLGWLLSNHNGEVDLADEAGTVLGVAFNANADGTVVDLGVETYDRASRREGGSQRFRLVVVEVADEDDDAETGRRWWVSWYGYGSFLYAGPWWVTGRELGGAERYIYCAAVIADDEDEARQVIADAYDEEELLLWRFVEPQADDWSPFGDRFQRAAWMQWPDA
jgi:hypothetical protein